MAASEGSGRQPQDPATTSPLWWQDRRQMHDCIKEKKKKGRASFPLGQAIFVNQNAWGNYGLQVVGIAVVWETEQGYQIQKTFFGLFSYPRDGPWLCPSASEDQGAWELTRLPWGDILCASDSWVLFGDLCSLSQGRMAGITKICAHDQYLCVCISTDMNICTCVFIYRCIYIYIYIKVLYLSGYLRHTDFLKETAHMEGWVQEQVTS